ncbi:uncharacterized protein LOC133931300 [Phragmites australis]|uniref:uncharacterized protein LOC133931300 n=1 Tax=Phragmites australis TaxID=29695 RepID=UPI002D77A536|nr:uncharacterized protein LOC133931300 [Phragmites australis]
MLVLPYVDTCSQLPTTTPADLERAVHPLHPVCAPIILPWAVSVVLPSVLRSSEIPFRSSCSEEGAGGGQIWRRLSHSHRVRAAIPSTQRRPAACPPSPSPGPRHVPPLAMPSSLRACQCDFRTLFFPEGTKHMEATACTILLLEEWPRIVNYGELR